MKQMTNRDHAWAAAKVREILDAIAMRLVLRAAVDLERLLRERRAGS